MNGYLLCSETNYTQLTFRNTGCPGCMKNIIRGFSLYSHAVRGKVTQQSFNVYSQLEEMLWAFSSTVSDLSKAQRSPISV